MIWKSALNIIAALIRNALQGKHQCISLRQEYHSGWEWVCSCGQSDWAYFTEMHAIKGFGKHLERKKVRA